MDLQKFIIKGGKPLQGHIRAAGAKNAMTKLLVASLISDKKCIFHNVPNIGDVQITVDLCKEIGSEINWDKQNKTLEIHTKEIKSSYIPQRFSGANRIPILMIGALLGRTSEDIIVPTVGGDLLGKRPVDFHIQALQSLGASIEFRQMKKEGAYFAQAHQGLHGALIHLPYPSVGATENSILAAVRAKGKTVIKNAATEPEVIDLILFLQKLGVHITLEDDRTISMHETNTFYETEHTPLTDRNEVASYALAAVTTKGSVFIERANHLHMIPFLNKLSAVGGGFRVLENGIEFFHQDKLTGGVLVETEVHPGFMTDWQQPFVVLLTQSEGISVVHETVYEKRFGYTQTLKEMGADVTLFKECLGSKPCRFANLNHNHSLVVKGPTPLHGKEISIPDLRAGFAYVMAGLVADDTTVLNGAELLDRGYEEIIEKLTSLGADIERVQEQKSTKLEALSSLLSMSSTSKETAVKK